MIEILSLISSTTIFYFFILLPKLVLSKNSSYKKNIFFYAIDNLTIFLFLMTLFSILRLNLYVSLCIICSLIFISLLTNFSYYIFLFKKNLIQVSIILLLIILFNFELVNNIYLGFDGQAIWFKKAYFLKNNLDPINTTMPNYPFLGSYLWAFFWKFSIIDLEHYGRFIYCIIFFISAVAYISFNKVNDIYDYILFGFITYYIFETNYLFNGYQDILVFSLLIVFFHYFIIFLNSRSKKNLIFLYLTAFILSWTKNEANIYSCVALFSLFFLNKNKKFLIINFLFILIIFFHKFLIYEYYFGMNMSLQSENYSFDSIYNFKINISNVLFIFFSFIKVFFKNLIIILIIPLITFFYVNQKNFSKKESYLIKILFLLFIVLIGVTFMFYIFTSFPLEWHISTSLDRLVFQLSSILIYPSIIIFKKLPFKQKRT
jgi:hypothetical protein